MRSGVGAVCPFTRRDLFLDELFPDLLDFLAVVPVVLAWAASALLVVLLWLVLDALFCAAAAGSVPPPAASAARIQPASVCLPRKVRMSGLCVLGRRLLAVRRNDARQKHRHGPVVVAVAAHFEHHVVASLQLPDSPAIIIHGIDRLPIHLGDDVAGAEPQVVGEAGGLHLAHHHALLPLHTNALRALRRKCFHAQAEFRRCWLVWRTIDPVGRIRENPRAIFDRRRCLALLLVAVVGDLDLAPDRRTRNRVHQIVPRFHRRT